MPPVLDVLHVHFHIDLTPTTGAFLEEPQKKKRQ